VLCHNASNARVQALIDYQLTAFDAGLAQTLAWYRDALGAKRDRS